MKASTKRRRRALYWWLPVGMCLALALALGTGPAFRTYRVVQARKALASHHAEQAVRWLEAAERGDPEAAEIQFLLARAHRKLGNLATASAHLKRAWKLGYPEDALQREQWMAAAQTGRIREVEDRLRAHLTESGEDAQEICEALVAGYLCNYNSNAARTWLDAWEADFPESAQPHYFRGLIWRHFELNDRAAAELSQALQLDPTRNDIRFELAKTHEAKHEFEAAERLYRLCREERGDDPQVLLGLANCLVRLGQEAEAKSLYQAVVGQWPGESRAQLGLANLELATGPERVVERLQPVAAAHPYDKELRYVLATALRTVGRADEAETHFAFVREANRALAELEGLLERVREDPHAVDERYRIGRTLMQYASPAKGAAWLRSVLELDPHHRPTHRMLADYYAQQDNERLAEEHRRKAGPEGASGEER